MPPVAVTDIGPVVAPEGTLAVTVVLFTNVFVNAEVPLNFTDSELKVKSVPVMVTGFVPTGPLVGVKVVIVGAAACAGSVKARRIRAVKHVEKTNADTRLMVRSPSIAR